MTTKKADVRSHDDWLENNCRMTRAERLAWERQQRELTEELTRVLWAIRQGRPVPAALTDAINALIESVRTSWGEPYKEVIDLDVLDPWYLYHAHPEANA